jgi:hypothetical protein
LQSCNAQVKVPHQKALEKTHTYSFVRKSFNLRVIFVTWYSAIKASAERHSITGACSYRVSNKSVYTFINACSSFMSGPIELKPIQVLFSGHSPYISDYESSAVFKMGSCYGLTFKTSH